MLIFALNTGAPAEEPPRVQSPEVHPDDRVTFRLLAPNVKEVFLLLEGAEKAPMKQGDKGIRIGHDRFAGARPLRILVFGARSGSG